MTLWQQASEKYECTEVYIFLDQWSDWFPRQHPPDHRPRPHDDHGILDRGGGSLPCRVDQATGIKKNRGTLFINENENKSLKRDTFLTYTVMGPCWVLNSGFHFIVVYNCPFYTINQLPSLNLPSFLSQ